MILKKIFDRFIDRLKRKKYTNLKLFFEIHLNKDQIILNNSEANFVFDKLQIIS